MGEEKLAKCFVNLPVTDLGRSTAFYQAVGGERIRSSAMRPRPASSFRDDSTRCCSPTTNIVIYLEADRRRARDQIVLLCISADSREGVDELVAKAASAVESPIRPEQDYGFMYGRKLRGSGRPSLGSDVDGHGAAMAAMAPQTETADA